MYAPSRTSHRLLLCSKRWCRVIPHYAKFTCAPEAMDDCKKVNPSSFVTFALWAKFPLLCFLFALVHALRSYFICNCVCPSSCEKDCRLSLVFVFQRCFNQSSSLSRSKGLGRLAGSSNQRLSFFEATNQGTGSEGEKRWKATWSQQARNCVCKLTGPTWPPQVRSHGGAFGGSATQILLCPEKICFKHYENKNLALQILKPGCGLVGHLLLRYWMIVFHCRPHRFMCSYRVYCISCLRKLRWVDLPPWRSDVT